MRAFPPGSSRFLQRQGESQRPQTSTNRTLWRMWYLKNYASVFAKCSEIRGPVTQKLASRCLNLRVILHVYEQFVREKYWSAALNLEMYRKIWMYLKSLSIYYASSATFEGRFSRSNAMPVPSHAIQQDEPINNAIGSYNNNSSFSYVLVSRPGRCHSRYLTLKVPDYAEIVSKYSYMARFDVAYVVDLHIMFYCEDLGIVNAGTSMHVVFWKEIFHSYRW